MSSDESKKYTITIKRQKTTCWLTIPYIFYWHGPWIKGTIWLMDVHLSDVYKGIRLLTKVPITYSNGMEKTYTIWITDHWTIGLLLTILILY